MGTSFFAGYNNFHYVHSALKTGLCSTSSINVPNSKSKLTRKCLRATVTVDIIVVLFRLERTTKNGGGEKLPNQISSASTSLPQSPVATEDWLAPQILCVPNNKLSFCCLFFAGPFQFSGDI